MRFKQLISYCCYCYYIISLNVSRSACNMQCDCTSMLSAKKLKQTLADRSLIHFQWNTSNLNNLKLETHRVKAIACSLRLHVIQTGRTIPTKLWLDGGLIETSFGFTPTFICKRQVKRPEG